MNQCALRFVVIGACTVAALAASSHARPDIEFVTIGDPGNDGYPLNSPPGYIHVRTRGRVDYEYRIGKYEVTTAQWMEFVNHYSVLGNRWKYFGAPVFWGAVQDGSYTGPGTKWKLSTIPNAAMIPVSGISWREAATFCNWLHNDKAPGIASIVNGAYDISTFATVGPGPTGIFTDQLTHNPGAKFWIPTFDEWIKAAHYDPDRYGAGEPGWWMFSHCSESAPVGGPPSIGQANTGFTLPNFGHFYIPLGSYPQTQSPWGLLDTAGMTAEHTEFYWPIGAPAERGTRGSHAGAGPDPWDRVYGLDWGAPRHAYSGYGVRVASYVPAP